MGKLAVADLNADGMPDVALAAIDTNRVAILLNPKRQTQCHINATLVYVHKQLQSRFTARVTPTSPATSTPQGIVTFWDSATIVLGPAQLVNGKASITVLLDPEPNPQWVKAIYKGDGSFKGCESPYLAIFQ